MKHDFLGVDEVSHGEWTYFHGEEVAHHDLMVDGGERLLVFGGSDVVVGCGRELFVLYLALLSIVWCAVVHTETCLDCSALWLYMISPFHDQLPIKGLTYIFTPNRSRSA